jgi:hypothetical protein
MAKSLHRTASAATARLIAKLKRRDPWPAMLATALETDESVLDELARLMRREHLSLDIGRMFLDTTYACQRLSAAHAGTNEALRQLALRLFEAVQRLVRRREDWAGSRRMQSFPVFGTLRKRP